MILRALFLFLLLCSPLVTGAQESIVGGVCSGTECSACHFVDLANNLIKWLIGVIAALFAVLILVAGFRLVMSGGNQSALQSAKDSFTNAIIGFVIVLAAWLIVDTLIRGLVGNTGQVNGRLWSEVQCWNQNVATTKPGSVALDGRMAGTDGATPPDLSRLGALGPVVTSPGGSTCFPGMNGVLDGSRPDSDDVCIDSSNVTGGAYALPNASHLGYTPPPGYFGPETIAVNPQITPNFRLCDVTNCDSARRAGDYIYIDPFMVQQLEGVRQDLGGFSVNSGYRSPAYNDGVGGATHSRHQYGDAVDIAVTSSNSEASIIASCRARGATNIYTYDSGAHVHCDWRGATR